MAYLEYLMGNKKSYFGVIIFQFIIQMSSFAEPKSHSLAEIFCTAIFQTGHIESNRKKLDEDWPELEKHLENGKLYSSLLSHEQLEKELEKIKNTPVFQKCLDETKSEFEYGQFILAGRKLVRGALLAYKGDSKSVLSSASFQFGNTTEIPDSLYLNLAEPQSSDENLKVLETLNEREKKYNSMWHRFIGELRSKTQSFHF